MAQAKSYGEVLKRCLEKSGMSQSKLAQMVGCSTSQISEYISGRSREPTLSRAKKIADALGVPLDEMISMMSTRSFYTTLTLALYARGMTTSDLCAKTGMHPSYFSQLSSGHTKDVTWGRAIAIIEALDMTPNEFYALQKRDD